MANCLHLVIRSSKWVGLEGLDERTSGSLIPETLQGMENDEEFQIVGEDIRMVCLWLSPLCLPLRP